MRLTTLLLSFLMGLFGLTGIAQNQDTLYLNAIADALQPNPQKVQHDLFAINSSNKELIWKEVRGNGIPYVKVVSYISAKDTTYYPRSSWSNYTFGTYSPWVTVAPQLKKTCSAKGFGKKEGLDLRMNQLLGLPPKDVKGWVITFWVRAADLYRPCADAEIDDCECGVILPANVSESHLMWYNNIRAKQYFPPGGGTGYPWTQLGYTYDYNPGNTTHFGLAEYIIRPGSSVVIENLTDIKSYCRK